MKVAKEFREKYLKKKEVAEMISCSIKHVERLVASGELARRKTRGAFRYRESDVISHKEESG